MTNGYRKDVRMTADAHEAAVARLRDAYAAWPPGTPVRLAKRTSNLFRFRDSDPAIPPDGTARAAKAKARNQVSLNWESFIVRNCTSSPTPSNGATGRPAE